MKRDMVEKKENQEDGLNKPIMDNSIRENDCQEKEETSHLDAEIIRI